MYRNEHHLAVMTNWALFGTFGPAFVITGFNGPSLAAGLFGFAILIGGFAAHIVVNVIYRTDFSKGQAALAFVLFALGALAFAVSWIAVPGFGIARATIGLGGFTAIFAAFVFYMFARHGVRGSFEMFDEIRKL